MGVTPWQETCCWAQREWPRGVSPWNRSGSLLGDGCRLARPERLGRTVKCLEAHSSFWTVCSRHSIFDRCTLMCPVSGFAERMRSVRSEGTAVPQRPLRGSLIHPVGEAAGQLTLPWVIRRRPREDWGS